MTALERLLRVRGLLITVREAIVDCEDEVSQAAFETVEQAIEILGTVLPDAERFGDGDPVTATHFVIVETATLGTAMHGFGETKEEAWAAARAQMPDGWTGENCIAIPCSAGLVAAGAPRSGKGPHLEDAGPAVDEIDWTGFPEAEAAEEASEP